MKHRFHIACYSPIQIERAYGVPELFTSGVTGKGQTIVIVDSFGSPTIRHDLKVFDARFHIPGAAFVEDHPARWQGAAVHADPDPGGLGR